jgi:hypothetical protein
VGKTQQVCADCHLYTGSFGDANFYVVGFQWLALGVCWHFLATLLELAMSPGKALIIP